MNTASFLSALRAQARLPLIFRRGGDTVPEGYHLTEVKSVAYRTMDCGAMQHAWAENQFELWVPARVEEDRGHMAADKFLRIVDRVQRELPLDAEAEARVFAGFPGEPAALHAIEDISVQDGALVVALSPDRARCKARERQARDGQGCGCGTKQSSATAAVACCA